MSLKRKRGKLEGDLLFNGWTVVKSCFSSFLLELVVFWSQTGDYEFSGSFARASFCLELPKSRSKTYFILSSDIYKVGGVFDY